MRKRSEGFSVDRARLAARRHGKAQEMLDKAPQLAGGESNILIGSAIVDIETSIDDDVATREADSLVQALALIVAVGNQYRFGRTVRHDLRPLGVQKDGSDPIMPIGAHGMIERQPALVGPERWRCSPDFNLPIPLGSQEESQPATTCEEILRLLYPDRGLGASIGRPRPFHWPVKKYEFPADFLRENHDVTVVAGRIGEVAGTKEILEVPSQEQTGTGLVGAKRCGCFLRQAAREFGNVACLLPIASGLEGPCRVGAEVIVSELYNARVLDASEIPIPGRRLE
jgi:hypothetical protein